MASLARAIGSSIGGGQPTFPQMPFRSDSAHEPVHPDDDPPIPSKGDRIEVVEWESAGAASLRRGVDRYRIIDDG